MRKQTTYDRTCINCEFASVLEDDSYVLCEKKGIVSNNYSCGKYVYDPLKRIPTVRPHFPKFEKEDIL